MKYLIPILLTFAFCQASEIHEFWIGEPRTEQNFSVDHLSQEEIEIRLKTMGGFYVTGRTKSRTWIDDKGEGRMNTLREVVYWNEEAEAFVHAWQGRYVPWTAVIFNLQETITGKEPKIKGSFYEPSS